MTPNVKTDPKTLTAADAFSLGLERGAFDERDAITMYLQSTLAHINKNDRLVAIIVSELVRDITLERHARFRKE